MNSQVNYLATLAAEERAAAWCANDVQTSRVHMLDAERYEAQAQVLEAQRILKDGPGVHAN